MKRLKKWIIADSDALTVVSRAMAEDVIKLGGNRDRIHVIPMGIDLNQRFTPPESRQESRKILFVGRLVEKKGVDYLIEAMPRVLEKHGDRSLLIVGDGPERKRLEAKIVALGLGEQVRFLGAVRNEFLPDLYRTADVVVFPSVIAGGGDREGFGLVLVEALGCGCAVVGTDLPAMRDIFQQGKTGLIVPQKNSELLARKINCLLDNPQLRRNLGMAGRRYVLGRFNWDSIAHRYDALMDTLLI
jgi:glycosyltransferase involved in cell wall biosynthesis